MKVEIFTVIKNEQDILPFFINNYRKAFSGCVINIYDNNSTDKSVKICKANNCNVFDFPDFIPHVKEELLTNFKNNIWKNSDADWIIVCDADELLHMSMNDLLSLQENVNVIRIQGYNMVDITEDDLPIEKLTHGAPSEGYSKLVMFKNKSISEINYSPGAHTADPLPNPVFSDDVFNLLHYKRQNFSLKNLKKAHENYQGEGILLDGTLENMFNNFFLSNAIKIL
jgi:glycosyltransferase involved in cell wall biosynthesis